MSSIRRPGRGTVRATEVGDRYLPSATQILHEYHGLLGLERDIGQATAIGRPGGRNDGLGRSQRSQCVLAIGISHLELEASGLLHHIGHAGAEHTALASEGFIDDISDLMRGATHLLRTEGVGQPGQLGLLLHVQQAKPHFEPAIRQTLRSTDQNGIGIAPFPVLKIDLTLIARLAAQTASVEHTKAAAARQIGLDDIGHRLWQL